MSEENKALVRRFVEEFWNEKNPDAADELMAADAVIHMPTGEVVDLAGLQRVCRDVAWLLPRLALHPRGTDRRRREGS